MENKVQNKFKDKFQDKIKSNFNISLNSDILGPSESLILANDVLSGYSYPMDDLLLQDGTFPKFLEKLKEKFKDIIEFDFSDSKRNIFKQYQSPDFIMYANGQNDDDIFVSFNCKNVIIANNIFKIYKEFIKIEDEVNIFMTSYFMNSGRLDESFKRLNSNDLKLISKKYYPYINTDNMFSQFFTLSENILILTGKPGLGKSKMFNTMLKFAVEHPKILPYEKNNNGIDLETQFINVAFVRSIDVLADDKFWGELSSKSYDFVIMDDLDYMLTKRDEEVQSQDDHTKNLFLNNFLSFTDGIEKHKTKFIITTNQPYKGLDLALLRKGRLFDILELRDLSNFEALDIWKDNNLNEDIFNEIFDDRVLQADLGSEIERQLNDKISKSSSEYLLEPSISKTKKVKKHLGF